MGREESRRRESIITILVPLLRMALARLSPAYPSLHGPNRRNRQCGDRVRPRRGSQQLSGMDELVRLRVRYMLPHRMSFSTGPFET
jgi:hypothetical protein